MRVEASSEERCLVSKVSLSSSPIGCTDRHALLAGCRLNYHCSSRLCMADCWRQSDAGPTGESVRR